MGDRILTLSGSNRSDRKGIRLVVYIVDGVRSRDARPELIDAKAPDRSMLGRMYKRHAPGKAALVLKGFARRIRSADAFVFSVDDHGCAPQQPARNPRPSCIRRQM